LGTIFQLFLTKKPKNLAIICSTKIVPNSAEYHQISEDRRT
jgi:hypothetical protein